jgi:hypothetical protein
MAKVAVARQNDIFIEFQSIAVEPLSFGAKTMPILP